MPGATAAGGRGELVKKAVLEVIRDCVEGRLPECLMGDGSTCNRHCIAEKAAEKLRGEGVELPEGAADKAYMECLKRPECTQESGVGRTCKAECFAEEVAKLAVATEAPGKPAGEAKAVAEPARLHRLAKALGLPQVYALEPGAVCTIALVEGCDPDNVKILIFCKTYEYLSQGLSLDEAEKKAVDYVGGKCGASKVLEALSGVK